MPLMFPRAFPSPNARDPVELYNYLTAHFGRAQKLRAGQFLWTSTVPAMTVRDVTFADPTDLGVDNLIAGMYVTVTPPVGTSPLLQLDYAFAPAAGQLTLQVRNATANPIAATGTWSYVGYTF